MHVSSGPSRELQTLIDFFKEILPNTYVWAASKFYVSSPYETSIGLIVQPGPQTIGQSVRSLVTNPMSLANWWGHTALYVRVNGKIVRAIGFDPSRIAMFNVVSGVASSVSTGRSPTPGFYYDEDKMFMSPDMMAVEFPVPKKTCLKVLKSLPLPGIADSNKTSQLQSYVTFGGEKLKAIDFDPDQMGNCIDFVRKTLRKAGLGMFDTTTMLSVNSRQGHMTRSLIQRQIALGSSSKQLIESTSIAMPVQYQLSRRWGGTMRTFAVGKVAIRALTGVANLLGANVAGPYILLYDALFLVTFIIDMLQEAVPEGSWITTAPVQMIEGIVSAGATMALGAMLWSGDSSAWISMLMTFVTLILTAAM